MSDPTITIKGKSPGEADYFYSLDRVLAGLIAALNANRVEEAVDVYSRCREDIGFQLISRAQGDPPTFKQVANLFFRARDYPRAAYCCEHLEEHHKAAALYERCDDFSRAAQMYAAAGDRIKAAEMFEKDLNYIEAGRLFRDMKELIRAASCFEKAKKYFDAAGMYQQAGQPEKAISILNLVDDDSPERKIANKVIKELMGEANLQRAATGTFDFAQLRQDAQAYIPQEPAQAAAPMPAPFGNAPFGSSEGSGPMRAAPGPSAPAPGPAAPPILMGGGQIGEGGKGIVTVMEGFNALQDVPLFQDLSLAELKALYTLCQLRSLNPGETLIQAGESAPALYIVMSGELELRTPGGAHVTMLGIGQIAGEMSLADDGPAAVDVVADAPTRVLVLDKHAFRNLLSTNDSLALRINRVFVRILTERLRETTARIT